MIDLAIDHTITVYDEAFYEYKAQSNPIFDCFLKAARGNEIHPDYIFTIWKREGGTTGEYNRNNDGTHDIGDMQINYETWAEEFLRLGFKVDWSRALYNQCDNVYVGAKIIKMRLGEASNVYTGLANYHWYSTAKNNAPHFVYKKKIIPSYQAVIKAKQKFISTTFVSFQKNLKE